MMDHEIAFTALQQALHGKRVTGVSAVLRVGEKTEPQNMAATARAAFVLSSQARADAEMSAETATAWLAERFATTSNEFGSPQYESYTAAAAAATPQGRRYFESHLALASLSLCDAATIVLWDLTGDHGRPRSHSRDNYHGGICCLPGNRRLWERGKPSDWAELNIYGPLAHWAMGRSAGWTAWDHPNLGWPMDAACPTARNGKGHDHGPTIALPTPLADRIAIIGRVPMRPSQRLDLLKLANGDIWGILNRSTHHTRGPVLISWYHAASARLMEISPAEPTSGGEWTGISAQLVGDKWETWQTSTPDKRITGTIGAAVEWHLTWDRDGCRQSGDVPEVAPPAPVPPEVAEALALFDQVSAPAGTELGDIQRNLAELMSRAQAGNLAGVSTGATSLCQLLAVAGYPVV